MTGPDERRAAKFKRRNDSMEKLTKHILDHCIFLNTTDYVMLKAMFVEIQNSYGIGSG